MSYPENFFIPYWMDKIPKTEYLYWEAIKNNRFINDYILTKGKPKTMIKRVIK